MFVFFHLTHSCAMILPIPKTKKPFPQCAVKSRGLILCSTRKVADAFVPDSKCKQMKTSVLGVKKYEYL